VKRLWTNCLTGLAFGLITVNAYGGGQAMNSSGPPPEVQQQMRERVRAQREQQLMLQRRQEEIQAQFQARMQAQAAAAAAARAAPAAPQSAEPPRMEYPQAGVLSSSSAPARTSAAPSARSAPSGAVDPQFAQVTAQFDQSSRMWAQISDMQAKALIIEHYIDLYAQFKTYIRKPAMFYANMINGMAAQNAQMLDQPMDQLLRIAAILEYDFNDGQNKDALAMEVLGSPEAVARNRARVQGQP